MQEDSRVLKYPLSPLGPNSTLDKYIEHCHILGDPHLGRRFTTGVPVHRLGHREAMVKEEFQQNVIGIKPGKKFHVCMGDLFDKYTVNNIHVDFAFETYRDAARRNPEVLFIVIQGNHDASKDRTKISSFEIFAKLCRGIKNIKVLTEHPEFITHEGLNFLFVPWVPFKTSSELLELEFPLLNKAKNSPFAAFGHWDIKTHGEDICENIIPYEHFTPECCDGVVTGHYHKPERTIKNKIELFVSGSMQPYAHGEEAENEMNPIYITQDKDTVENNLLVDDNYYKDNVLRILLEPEHTPLSDINCLALTHKKIAQIDVENGVDVGVDDFNLNELFTAIMSEKGVSSSLTKELWGKL